MAKITPRCVWELTWETLLLKGEAECVSFFQFSAEYDLLSLLATIWIESHFPLKEPIIDFLQVTVNSIADFFIWYTTENREVSSAKSLALDDKPSGKSLI